MRQILAALFCVAATAIPLEAQDNDRRRDRSPLISARTIAATQASRGDDTRSDKAAAPARDDAAQHPEQPARRRLQIGVGMKSTTTPGAGSSSSLRPEVMWRWRGKTAERSARLVPSFRLGSFSSAISSTATGARLEIGDLRVRPLMAGVDYLMPRGKWQWSVGAAAGWSMNGMQTGDARVQRAAAAVGADDFWADVHNSFAWGPRVVGVYDMTDRVSFLIDTSYLSIRPLLDMNANGRLSTTRVNADAMVLKVGVVYAIY